MAAASAGLHESADGLQPATVDRHRALVSIMEELEAVDWYAQRAEASQDAGLAAILVHNGNEEKEHAMMVLEWLRRRDPVLDGHMRTYLFTEGPIVGIEAAAEHGAPPSGAEAGGGHTPDAGSLGIGSLTGAMNHLYRELAPISDAAWSAIEDETRTRVVPYLGARKLIDFEGPLGWQHSATNLGRTELLSGSLCDGVVTRQRRVLPLLEARAAFEIARTELDDADRGASDNDFGDLERAARQIALAENQAVFHGYPPGGIRGITEASTHQPIQLDGDFEHYPAFVARAVNALMERGIGGPYGLALSPAEHTGVIETTEDGGYLVFDHLRRILDGPIVWTPGLRAAVVLRLRGGDFRLESGQDLSIGYRAHDQDSVQLYLEQTFSFRVTEPDAAVELRR